MSPFLALLFTLAFIVFLFGRDFRERPNITGALWLPFLWIVVGPGSRFLSQWLNIFGFQFGGVTVEDGSPVDAIFYLSLILGGIFVIRQRRFSVSDFIRNNPWLAFFLAYCLLAVLWSDFPYVSLKRWIKLFGDPVMALVILTEPEPLESLSRLIKRCAYVMLPISILFIKYFPNLGRLYDAWSGTPMNTGIATNKNELGFDCWILGVVLFWYLLQVIKWERGSMKKNEMVLCAGLLAMDLWLLEKAHSVSSLIAFMLSAAIILFLGFRWVNKQRAGGYLLAAIVFCLVVGIGLGLVGNIIHLFGRNETLTGRTDIWKLLWGWDVNPLVGTGFESFWLGERRETIQNIYPTLNEAHNGYLETYLNLGAIGVLITVGMLLAIYAKTSRELVHHFEFGRLRLAYLISFIVYNWTEAAFRENALPFFMFFLIAMELPRYRQRAFEAAPATYYDDQEMDFATNQRMLN